MNININDILKKHGLKVTPQRVVILETLINSKIHPTAENIKEYIEKDYPNIALGTVYQVLETFCKKGIIKRVKTEDDIMRYDANLTDHHHLYNCETNEIIDYYDEDLTTLLKEYFAKKNINNFLIKEIHLQINGNFIN